MSTAALVIHHSSALFFPPPVMTDFLFSLPSWLVYFFSPLLKHLSLRLSFQTNIFLLPLSFFKNSVKPATAINSLPVTLIVLSILSLVTTVVFLKQYSFFCILSTNLTFVTSLNSLVGFTCLHFLLVCLSYVFYVVSSAYLYMSQILVVLSPPLFADRISPPFLSCHHSGELCGKLLT